MLLEARPRHGCDSSARPTPPPETAACVCHLDAWVLHVGARPERHHVLVLLLLGRRRRVLGLLRGRPRRHRAAAPPGSRALAQSLAVVALAPAAAAARGLAPQAATSALFTRAAHLAELPHLHAEVLASERRRGPARHRAQHTKEEGTGRALAAFAYSVRACSRAPLPPPRRAPPGSLRHGPLRRPPRRDARGARLPASGAPPVPCCASARAGGGRSDPAPAPA